MKVSQPGIPAWGAQQRELPFGQLHGPRGVAVDTAGNVFVIDFDRDRISSHQRGRVLKLAAGADHPTELPFPDLDFPNGIAVDATGSVYVTGGNAEQLSMLKPETTTPTPVFTGITLNGVAVDSGGNVYASDAISRVWRLTAGTDELAALHIEQDPSGVAVDTAGAVYITVTNGTSDGGQVLLPDLIYRLRLDDRLDPVFASMALRSAEARHTLSSAARGTSQSMVKLRGEDILNVIVPVPPLAEQQAIVQHHDTRMERVNSLVSTLAAQIELLRERRQALITAAVTGEIEV